MYKMGVYWVSKIRRKGCENWGILTDLRLVGDKDLDNKVPDQIFDESEIMTWYSTPENTSPNDAWKAVGEVDMKNELHVQNF